jgi:hypothetical protein
MRNFVMLAVGLIAVSCASGRAGKRFDDMNAAEHRAAAAREHRAADEDFARAREKLGPPPPSPPAERDSPYYGPGAEFFDPTWDPQEPEHYTVDERVRVRGEEDAAKARRHREKARAHEDAAGRLEDTAD